MIRVGGGIRGGEGLAIADRAYVADGVVINADATDSGNGGSIVVFSRDNSVIAGSLLARGGISGGNGGFAETSSHGGLTVTGTPQVTARNASGLGGNWLIDPNNITIVAGGGRTNINSADPFLSTDDSATLGVNLITAALTGGASVAVTTGSGGTNAQAGNITLNADLNYNGKGTNALTLDAAHDIVINNRIFDSTSGGDVLNLSLLAGNSIILANDISLGAGSATLTATAGSITQTAGMLSAGTLNATAATGINLNTAATLLNVVNTGATGDIAITEADGATVQALQQTNTANTAGTVSLTSATGDIGINDGSVLSQGGLVTLTATTGAITDADGGAATSITNAGGQATLSAATGIGFGDGIDTQVSTLAFTNSNTDGVAVVNADAMTVSGSTALGLVNLRAQTGDLTVGGDVSSADNVALSAGSGNIVHSSGTVSGNAVNLSAGGTNGSIGASGAVLTSSTQLDFTATGTGAVQIIEADGTALSGTAGSGNVAISSTTGNLAINGDIGTTGNVDLSALAGSITHNAGTISGNALTLTAGGANGAIGASGAILTDVASIAFAANGTGAVNITEASGADVSGTAGSGNVGITSTTADLGVVAPGIITAGGAVTLTASTDGARINIGAGATVDTTNGAAAGANVSLVADNADIFGTIDAGTAGTVAIRQATAGRQISLGADAPTPAPPQLGLTNAELDQITANAIVIGDANTGDVGIYAAITPAHAATLSLNSGGAISQVAGATLTVGTLTGSSVGATTLGEANQIGNLGSFTASDFSVTNAIPLVLVDDVTTSGSQTYDTAVSLGSDRVLSGSNITFNSTVDGGYALSVNASGATTFAGAVGGASALTSLTTDAGGSTVLGGNVTTTGTQFYDDAVVLNGDTILTSSAGGNIRLGSTVNGAQSLVINTSGATTFAKAVGGTSALTSLSTGAGGSTTLGGSVTTTGAQTYNDAVGLAGNATLTSSGGGDIVFANTLNGAHDLVVDTSGLSSFGGAVGGTNALTSLTTRRGSFAANALDIGAGGLSVTTTTGGIVQGGAFVVTGASSFNAGTNAITLTNANNDFTGAVSLTGGATQITDKNALTLGTLSTSGALTASSTGALNLGSGSVGGNLTATSNNGAISQAGALGVTGTSALDAGNGAIALTNANNDFQGAVTVTGAGVSLVDVNDLSVSSLTDNANGNVSLIAGGALTLPASALSAGAGNLTLAANGGVLSTGGALGGTNVSLTGRDGVTLGGDVSALGTLTLASTNAAITQLVGAITVAGPSTVTAGTGAITLTGVANDFAGAVSLTGGVTQITDSNALALGTLSTGNLAATSTGALNLGSGTVIGNLVATSNNGAINQTGALHVTGSSTINAGGGAIALANASNDFTGAVNLSNSGANNVSIRDANGLILGNVSVGTGTLGVQAVGITQAAGTAIVQSAAAGAASFNSGGGVLTLANTGNDFTGAVSLTGGATQITDSNALALGTLSTGNLAATSTGALNLGSGTVTGNLAATSNNGAISQTGALTVTGSSMINAGASTIMLTNAGNDFTGAVSLSNSGANDVAVSNANALVLGASTIGSGALDLTATGISQTGAIVQAVGGGAVTLNAGAGDLTLTDAGNDFTGQVTASGQAIRIADATALDMVGFTSAAEQRRVVGGRRPAHAGAHDHHHRHR